MGGTATSAAGTRTHADSPSPSPIDLATARAMSEQANLKLPHPLFIIVATTASSRRVVVRHMKAWLWSAESKTMVEIRLRTAHIAEWFCPCETELLIPE